MKKCTDLSLGKMLHAYELGALPEEEEQKVEVHLLQCEYCFTEFRRFAGRAEFLSGDDEAKELIAGIVAERQEAKPWFRRVLEYLWPSAPIIFRPALLYPPIAVLLLLLVFPTDKQSIIQEASQSIDLTAIRRPQVHKFEKRDGWGALIVESPFTDQGEMCVVTIEGPDQSVVYNNDEFTGFTGGRGLAVINLLLADLERGKYRLVISGLSDTSEFMLAEHYFLIE